MFIEFTIENFRSIRERQTFSMMATSSKELLDENTFLVNPNLRMLRSSVLYGANASGKSTFFMGLVFFLRFTVESGPKTQIGDSIPTTPFVLSKNTINEPSSFEIVFYIDKIRYRYGISVNKKEVIREYLYAVNVRREVELFSRSKQNVSINSTYFKEGLTPARQSAFRNNASILSTCAMFNGTISESIVKYFRSHIVCYAGGSDFSTFSLPDLDDNEVKQKILNFLHFADIQVTDLFIDDHNNVISNLPDSNDNKISKDSNKNHGSQLKFGHTIFDNDEPVGVELLNVDEESSGTKKILAFAGILLRTLDEGRALFIDEFDARLHPLIIEQLIKLFNSPQSNPNNGQLIITSHAINIMTNKIFRRDQIWFFEKDYYGATEFYSLAEYKKSHVRNDASYSKNYLLGNYGGVPYIRTILDQVTEKCND